VKPPSELYTWRKTSADSEQVVMCSVIAVLEGSGCQDKSSIIFGNPGYYLFKGIYSHGSYYSNRFNPCHF